jgi:histidinol-phosphate aminotransferase
MLATSGGRPFDRTVSMYIPLAIQRENVLVARTFSKLYGMAGLRVGYALGHQKILTRLRPFQVGLLSLNATGLAAASASLEDYDFQRSSREMARYSRTTISKELQRLGFQVADSDAACLWADWGRPVEPMVRALAQRGVFICSGQRWNVPTAVRISFATAEQTTTLLTEINNIVG